MALATDATTAVAVDIDPQPLAAALVELSKQGHLQLVLSMSQLPAKVSVPLHGTMALGAAIDVLLRDTGLTYKFVGDHTIAIVRANGPIEGSTGGTNRRAETVGSEAVPVPPRNDAAAPESRGGNNSKSGEGNNKMSTHHGFWSWVSHLFSGNRASDAGGDSSSARVAKMLALCGSMGMSALTCVAQAQTAGGAQATGAAEGLQEVTVTGSRVISNGNDSPTPVTVVSMDQLMEVNPGPVTQALTQLPALLATPNQGGQGSGPAPTINLRGIGAQRNLILVDGHRVAPTTNGAGVDVNLIPTMLLQRVDIVTGGASAVYGSDAVSGVVNYVMDSNFNGVKVTGQMGQTTFHDDNTYNIGIAAGTSLFGGRGHIEFSYQNFNDPGIPCRCSRSWGQGLWSMQGSVAGSKSTAGTAVNPFGLYSNTRLNGATFGGLINSGPLAGLQFSTNGQLSPFNHGTPTGSASAEIGGDGAYYTTVTAFAGQNMGQGFTRFDYDFANDVKAYAELGVSSVLYWTNGANQDINRTIGYNNAYLSTIQSNYRSLLPASLQSGAGAIGTLGAAGNFSFRRILNQGDDFPAARTETRSNQFLFLSGLSGSLAAYKWDLGYEHSDAVTDTWQPNALSQPRLFAALNAVVNPANGQIVCNASLVNPAYANCVPLDLFGPTATNRASFNYIQHQNFNSVTYLMDDVTASLTGAPLSTWAGPIDMALSAEWRTLSYRVMSNADPSDPVDCTGIQFNCVGSGSTATLPYSGTTGNFPKTKMTVDEFAYEAEVPLLKGAALAKSVDINAAARYTNYSTSGVVWSWKLGLTWALGDSLELRATRSRDIRAPTLQNLFQPIAYGNLNFSDLHTNSSGNIYQITQGNPSLKPELADTWTYGLVWTPQLIEGFSASVDGYHIKINQGLAALSVGTQGAQLACEASGGTSPICAYYNRPFPFSDTNKENFPTSVINPTLNTAAFITYGADAEIDYRREIAGHPLRMRLLANYQPHLVYDLGFSGAYDVGGAADGVAGLAAIPNVKATFQASYDLLHDLTATMQERYRNAEKQYASGPTPVYFAIGEQPPTFYTDLTLNYRMQPAAGDLELFLNIKNLFNKQPDPWASSGGNTQIGSFGGWLQGDDPLGRYYTVGFRYKL
jgi:outer membrane receptor protein involved in Fe transport